MQQAQAVAREGRTKQEPVGVASPEESPSQSTQRAPAARAK